MDGGKEAGREGGKERQNEGRQKVRTNVENGCNDQQTEEVPCTCRNISSHLRIVTCH
jgi:hypothetical protein